MELKEFDLLFFRRETDNPLSYTFAKLSKMRFGADLPGITHVGMVVSPMVMNIGPNIPNDRLFLLESTLSANNSFLSNLDNVANIDGDFKIGVQIRPLNEILGACHADNIMVYVRRFKNNNLLMADIANTRAKMNNLYTAFRDAKYTISPLNMFGALFQCCTPCQSKQTNVGDLVKNRASLTTIKETPVIRVFSSQFVTMIMQELDILPRTILASAMLPIELAIPNCSDDPQFVMICDVNDSYNTLEVYAEFTTIGAPNNIRKLTTAIYIKYFNKLLAITTREITKLVLNTKTIRIVNDVLKK